MSTVVTTSEGFNKRHLGPQESDLQQMLQVIGTQSLSTLMDETIPKSIRLKTQIQLPPALTEYEYLSQIKKVAQKNNVLPCFGALDKLHPFSDQLLTG